MSLQVCTTSCHVFGGAMRLLHAESQTCLIRLCNVHSMIAIESLQSADLVYHGVCESNLAFIR